ncbi:hypothetical protein QYE76_051181 [Lolium multiflorum]|uniref:Reverse transcriptase zinc-binding domain-containing protein n=1 Tax=Lolium multiflorum TaxID=4521 RepID=A0AAD8WHN5_LOLMU|nr:hypothetical protein QYE76_051181 [Lolium multiflorum]
MVSLCAPAVWVALCGARGWSGSTMQVAVPKGGARDGMGATQGPFPSAGNMQMQGRGASPRTPGQQSLGAISGKTTLDVTLLKQLEYQNIETMEEEDLGKRKGLQLYQNAEGLWADLIRAKYLGDRDLFDKEVPVRGSQFWNAIQKIKWHFKLGARHKVRNGKRTYFWLDWWSGSGPLRARFPRLYSCCDQPFITVDAAKVRDGPPGAWRIRFRRQFSLAETVEWDNLCREIQDLPTDDQPDVVSWSLEPSGVFSAKSVYYGLTQGASVSHFRDVWRARVPPKIKVFLWQLIRGKLPSSEQVAKRQGPSNGRCSLCGEVEDCNHIFFTCHMAGFMWAGVRELLHCEWNPGGIGDFIALAQGISGPLRSLVWFTFAAMSWSLWNIRNKLTIEGKLINNPTDAFYHMMLHMQSWRVLVRRRDRALLDEALEAVRLLHARSRAGGE